MNEEFVFLLERLVPALNKGVLMSVPSPMKRVSKFCTDTVSVVTSKGFPNIRFTEANPSFEVYIRFVGL